MLQKEIERRISWLEQEFKKHVETIDAHDEPVFVVKTNDELQKELKDNDN